MYEAIKNFAKQFAFEPVVENAEKLPHAEEFIVAGMGGSNLASGLLKIWKPELSVISHRDYGLPHVSEYALEKTLVIASSYSGNTEETLDGFEEALKRGMPVAAIAAGGKLLEMAKQHGVPFVQLPDTGIQPRSALGFSIKAMLKLMGEEQALAQIIGLATLLNPLAYEEAGKELVNRLAGRVPVIYASSRNFPIAYNWKIKFNETGKIPAFCSALPEANHNEMTGFNIAEATRPLSQKFYIILLKDADDDPRVIARMDILAKLYQDRGLPVVEVPLQGANVFYKIFSSLVLADWTAYYIARHYDVDPEHVPMVEELKRLIALRQTK
ncbi:MAG: bifunctional phosphoglucose/phosphomannose isomerase [Candidatus Sungbacteria bacterium]|nr:bifunctional phosphoglucose/phosphomannose isomerase [Candidatus Sungbacteria bacterium]